MRRSVWEGHPKLLSAKTEEIFSVMMLLSLLSLILIKVVSTRKGNWPMDAMLFDKILFQVQKCKDGSICIDA